jgi:hypothetical protein
MSILGVHIDLEPVLVKVLKDKVVLGDSVLLGMVALVGNFDSLGDEGVQ